jgi:thiol:disulfide interchange protein DsbC
MKKIYLAITLLMVHSIANALTKDEVGKQFGVDASNMAISKAPVFSGNFYALSDKAGTTIFISEDMRYAISGNVIDKKTGKNLSEAVAAKFDWKDLKKIDSIQMGSGDKSVIVFADPQCGYCKQLERELDPLRNQLTIFVVPVPILGPDSQNLAKNIWCADDRASAWDRALKGDPIADAKSCSTPFDANLSLAKKYGVNGTPAIVFPNGEIVRGFIPTSEFRKRISK